MTLYQQLKDTIQPDDLPEIEAELATQLVHIRDWKPTTIQPESERVTSADILTTFEKSLEDIWNPVPRADPGQCHET